MPDDSPDPTHPALQLGSLDEALKWAGERIARDLQEQASVAQRDRD